MIGILYHIKLGVFSSFKGKNPIFAPETRHFLKEIF